ncbi:MAG: lipid-binding SYLF domain-containing protein [Thermoguttaceae bacterium]
MPPRFLLALLSVLVLRLLSVSTTSGQTVVVSMPSREAEVVDASRDVLGQIMSIPARSIPESLLGKAEGIAIFPGMLKGGFIVGVRHGRGVIVTRDEAGQWKPPLFVEITGISFGWQIGIQGTDLILVFRTKNSLQNLMRGKFTIGVNASAAAGPVGRDAQAATDITLKAELLSYSRSRGLFAGVALDGAASTVDPAATDAYYQTIGGRPLQPGQPTVVPPSAGRLLEQLAKCAAASNTVPAIQAVAATMPVAVDPQILRGQLAASSRQLAAIVDASWRTYLALPAEVYSGDRAPSAEKLRQSLDRFATVAGDSRYRALTERPEFRSTASLLRQYSAIVSAPASPSLPLPPPPK